MNVVDAINRWIDKQTDDLDDGKFDEILDLVDHVELTPLAQYDTDDVVDTDIDAVVETIEDPDRAAYAAWLLRTAIYRADLGKAPTPRKKAPARSPVPAGQPDSDALLDQDSDTKLDDTQLDDTQLDDTEPATEHDLVAENDEHPSEDIHLVPEEVNSEDPDLDDIQTGDPIPGAIDDDDLEPTQLIPTVSELRTPDLDFGAGDSLGPSFLGGPDVDVGPDRNWLRYAAVAVLCAGMFAFLLGLVQLVQSLGDDDELADTADATAEVANETTGTAEAPPTTEPTAAPTPDESAANPAAAEPAATPAPPRPDHVAMRLQTGSIVLATLTHTEVGTVTTTRTLYDASDENLRPAAEMAWMGRDMGVVDDQGNVVVVNVFGDEPARVVWQVGDDFLRARAVTPVGADLAVLTDDGSLVRTSRAFLAEPDDVEMVWDAEAKGNRATMISSVWELVPFVVDNGDVLMYIGNGDVSEPVAIWSSSDQPPAANVFTGPDGVLMGIGQGAIARYRLAEDDGPPTTAIWDPFSTEETPAISYAPAGNLTAVVLQDGGIVLADDTMTGERIWDPEETELLAVAVAASDNTLIALLETGSVVHVDLTGNRTVNGSVWDVTDETLAPAIQIRLRPR